MLYAINDDTAVDPMAVTLAEIRQPWLGATRWQLTITVRSGRKTEAEFATLAAAREVLLGLMTAIADAGGRECSHPYRKTPSTP